jgi:hypothetical protein
LGVFVLFALSGPQLSQPPQAPAGAGWAARCSTDDFARTRLRINRLANARRQAAGINVQLLYATQANTMHATAKL